MDELNMFNFLEDKLHIVRTIGPSLETLWKHCVKRSVASLEHCWWEASSWKKGTLDRTINVIHYESQVMGFASSCIKFMNFFMLNKSSVKVNVQAT